MKLLLLIVKKKRFISYEKIYFFLFLLLAPRGGVTGRPAFRPPYWNLRLSAGFNIWNEHINVSSTDIIAPVFWKEKWYGKFKKKKCEKGSGGTYRHCQIHHSSLARRTVLPVDVLQRTRNRLLQLDELDRLNQSRVFLGIFQQPGKGRFFCERNVLIQWTPNRYNYQKCRESEE